MKVVNNFFRFGELSKKLVSGLDWLASQGFLGPRISVYFVFPRIIFFGGLF